MVVGYAHIEWNTNYPLSLKARLDSKILNAIKTKQPYQKVKRLSMIIITEYILLEKSEMRFVRQQVPNA